MEKIQPAAELEINDLEALKVIADPFRNEIIETLLPAPLSPNQIAERLGQSTSKLYYHLNLLEKHGFIHVVNTEVQGNLIEKFYWVTALNFKLQKHLLNFDVRQVEGRDNLISSFTQNLDLTRQDIVRSMQARHHNLTSGLDEPKSRSVLDSRVVVQITDARAEEFHARLRDLLAEFNDLDESDDPNAVSYALTLLYYPRFFYKDDPSHLDGEPNDGNQ